MLSRSVSSASPRLQALSLAAIAGLVLVGCSSDDGDEDNNLGDSEALEGISLELDDENSPELTVDDPIEADEASGIELSAGDGEELSSGDVAVVNTLIADPESGEVTAENFTVGEETVSVDDQLEENNAILYQLLEGSQIGSEMAMYMPEAATTGQPQLLVFHVTGKTPEMSEGTAVDEDDLDDRLPEVTLDDDTGEPTIENPEGDPPEELISETLIEGDGEELEATDTVTLRYQGVKWSDGEIFDGTWDQGTTQFFELDQLIEGWQEGLEGKTVGSQVEIVVPPEMGYGESDGHELQDETLVFVVDILHTVHAEES